MASIFQQWGDDRDLESLLLNKILVVSVWGDVRIGFSSLLFAQDQMNHLLRKMLDLELISGSGHQAFENGYS